jgi:hypothetical protein
LDSTPTDRGTNGRFLPGHQGGPGRPRGSVNALRQAAEEAVTPEQVAALTRKVLLLALQGNLTAARLLYDRTCGRAAEAPAQPASPIELSMPNLDTAANCNLALGRLAEAVCAGTVDRDAAKLLIDVIQARLKAIEVGELEKRIGELEAIADTVEHKGPRRLRRS